MIPHAVLGAAEAQAFPSAHCYSGIFGKSKKDTWRQPYLKLLEEGLEMLICQNLNCQKNTHCSPVVNKVSCGCMVSIEAAGASSGYKGDER